MKVRKKYEVPYAQIRSFLLDHAGEILTIHDAGTFFRVSIDTEMTQAEFHMENLRLLADSNTVTAEEKDAINYGISAIKTLEDMGVII